MFSEYFVHKVTFEMDKMFNRTYDQDDKTHHWQHRCSRISEISFECDTKYKDWALHTKFVFNGTNVIEHKTNKDKNVKTSKTYQRISLLSTGVLQTMKEGLTDTKHAKAIADELSKSEEDDAWDDFDAWE